MAPTTGPEQPPRSAAGDVFPGENAERVLAGHAQLRLEHQPRRVGGIREGPRQSAQSSTIAPCEALKLGRMVGDAGSEDRGVKQMPISVSSVD